VCGIMRVIRNVYLWMVLGSLAFVWLMGRSSSVHLTKQEAQEMREEREDEGKDPDGMPPFAMGFATACILGGFWYAVYASTPKPPAKRDDRQPGTDID